MRKIGNVLLDLEPLLDEMVDQGLQTGDVLALIKSHLDIHRPDAKEEYEDGTSPIYYYGPKDA
jgi:hypothetical protein